MILSVVMATFNESPHFFKKCIDSILGQSFSEFELIIVVEPGRGNIDYLRSIAEKDSRVKIIENESKMGFVKSLNIGVKESTGKYIARIDSDDYCDPKRFEKQVRFLDKNGEISIVGTNMYLVDEHNNIIGKRDAPEKPEDIRKEFLLSTPLAHPSAMIRREDLYEVGLYREEFIRSEDLEIFLRFLARHKKLFNLQEYLVYFRTKDGQVKRDNLHWQYAYRARREYGKHIWPFRERFLSLFLYFIISKMPDMLIDRMFNLRVLVGFINRIRKIKA